MQLMEGVIIALQALWANKLRTILTLLGNIVGVMSVIAVVSIIDGANSYIRTEVANEGSGIFTVTRFSGQDMLSDYDKFLKSLHNPKITLDDLDYLRERVTLAEYMDGNVSTSAQVKYVGKNINSVNIMGRSEFYPLMGKWELKEGRHFTALDVQRKAPVAVIGFDIADRLFAAVDPVGKSIKIGGIDHQIIGVLEKKGGVMGGNANLVAVIPITAYQRLYGSRDSIRISVKAANLDQVRECADQARQAMRNRRHLGPRRDDNFAIITSDNLISLWERISSGIFASLIGVVSISLVVGGIVIMNIMLVSVTERTREIGIRKALGATRKNILWQFMVEAVTLSSVGGILGIGLGFTAAALVAYFSPLPYAIKIWSILIGMGVSFAVGVFFGAYPAMQAAKLDPIEALRYE
ncbi:MAG: macB 48 [Acidobacteria bacterium]|jgi:putative ABC transport system permease protein|nr:macB 48 [Acidobacteriota bacterium]